MIDWCDWSCELAKWQTLIAGIVGIGVALVAYCLSRRRDRALRDEEAKAVAAAMYGELILIASDLSLLADTVLKAEERQSPLAENEFDTFIPPPLVIRDSVSHKSGLLPPPIFSGFAGFYQRTTRVGRAFSYGRHFSRMTEVPAHFVIAYTSIQCLHYADRFRPIVEAYLGFSDPFRTNATWMQARYDEAVAKAKKSG